MEAPPILAAVRSWFSPAVLFVLLNLVVGTIVVSSKGIFRGHRRQREEEAEEEVGAGDHRRIYRTPSTVLERLRSIGSLYRSPSGEVPLEAAAPLPEQEAVPAEEHYFGRSKSEEHTAEWETLARRAAARSRSAGSARGFEGEEEVGADGHRRISRITSTVLERLRSIGGLYRSPSGEVPVEAAAPQPEHEVVPAEEHHFGRSKSEEHPAEWETLARRAAPRSRSASSARGFEGEEEEEEEEEEELNAKADNFINRFRQQLKLQRLDSILRYKDMLNRGR